MSTNFKSDPLSDAQIVVLADGLRRHLGCGEHDVLAMLERDTILTRFGIKTFGYQVVPDEELGGDEAITLITSTHVRVHLSLGTMEEPAPSTGAPA